MRKHNEYRKFLDYYEIILYKPNSHEEIACTRISLCDYDLCNQIFWTLSEYGYTRGYCSKTKRTILLHKYIMNSPSVELLDHKDRNKLNCTRENLSIANKKINSINRDLQPNSTTGHKGISIDKRRNKYRAYIKVDGIQISLGYHLKLEDAIEARKQGELKYFNYKELNVETI